MGKELGMQIGKIATGVAGQAANAGLGMLLQGWNDKRQIRQQQKLTDMQIEGTNRLADRAYERSIKMWEDTNYQAQMGQLEKAGLNPALIYGQGGAGGTTQGANGGGGVSGGQAPSGGGEIMGMMMQRAQLELMDKQKENIEANTNKTNVEATKTAGIDTKLAETQVQNLTQGIQNQKAIEVLTKAETEIKNIQGRIAGATEATQVEIIGQTFDKINREVENIENSNDFFKETKQMKIGMVRAELAGQWIENSLKGQMEKESVARIKNMVNEIMLKTKGLNQQQIQWELNRGFDQMKLGQENFRWSEDQTRQWVQGLTNVLGHMRMPTQIENYGDTYIEKKK